MEKVSRNDNKVEWRWKRGGGKGRFAVEDGKGQGKKSKKWRGGRWKSIGGGGGGRRGSDWWFRYRVSVWWRWLCGRII